MNLLLVSYYWSSIANSQFAEGKRKVMDGAPATSVPLDDFPPLGSDSMKHAAADQ